MTQRRPANRRILFASAAATLVIVAAGLALLLGSIAGEPDAARAALLREAAARTPRGSVVYDCVEARLRSPAYRFRWLPAAIRQRIAPEDPVAADVRVWILAPPAAMVVDEECVKWLSAHPQLASHTVHHYLPWRKGLWLAGLSGRVDRAHSVRQWYAPVTGEYRLFASPALASHPWLSRPLRFDGTVGAGFGEPAAVPDLLWYVNDRPAAPWRGVLTLKRGESVTVVSMDPHPLGIFLLPAPPQDAPISAPTPTSSP